ncbi:MAG: SusD/RagB family nutrient-binding outer membrane lipoprotein [Saprospiraceae bacterium]|nr:SusD/RagB family nutrient-binding outer membrane lipoprotein [Saprospiraceae bacterium]
MKYLNKLFLVFLLGFTLSSCSDLTELDLLDNPNAVTPENAGIDFLYNNIQLGFRNLHNGFHFDADGLVRYTTMGAFTYNNALTPVTGNGEWNNAYATLFPDMDALIALAQERELNVYEGNTKVMKAYVLTSLVDFFKDVPYSEAGQGTDIISPVADEGSTIYAEAEALLDEAIGLLEQGGATPQTDIYYGGSTSNWITLAKTMKLRNALHKRLTDSGAGNTIASIVSAGDIIDQNSEDFVFAYGGERDDPPSRHPFYNNHYENGDGTYMGNYIMWLMCCEKEDADGNVVEDPRIRYYFYRQVDNSLNQDVNVYSCVLSDRPDDPGTYPAHYAAVDPRLPYCVASPNGYYGRDHGNGSGIPPDGPIRTVYGLYPGGGKWDGNTYDIVQNGGIDGGTGKGIMPIITASSVDFMRAEAALTAGTGEDARALLESGVRKSMSKVLGFASVSPGDFAETVFDPILGEDVARGDVFGATDDDVEAYVAQVLTAYDAASDKLDVVMTEAYLARWGNAVETFNAYRRTGKPNNMQPGVDVLSIDEFPKSFLLPAVHVNQNANVTQKTIYDLVFWDNGSAQTR